MLDLITPTDHQDAYAWLTALLGHACVGVVLMAVLAALIDWLSPSRGTVGEALLATVVGYFLLWEVGVQRLGAGMLDAEVDTFGVMAGAVIGMALWRHSRALGAAMLACLAVVAAWGVRRRK